MMMKMKTKNENTKTEEVQTKESGETEEMMMWLTRQRRKMRQTKVLQVDFLLLWTSVFHFHSQLSHHRHYDEECEPDSCCLY